MMPANETEFVTTTAKKGMAEVKAAQLGVEKAEDPKVKELAQMLVTDHTAANAQLKTVAGELSIELSDDRDEKTQQKYKELSALSGKEFDQAFLAHMHKCHNKSIAFMEAGRKVSKSDGVIAFIEKTLPVIKGHTKMIGELHVATPDEGATAKPDTAPRGSQPQAGTERR